MKVPSLDLKRQYATVKAEVDEAIRRVVECQGFILGPEVEGIEKEVAGFCGVKHGVGVASGSEALHIALMAAGIGRGDEVITTSYTFFATAGAIHEVGARPVFLDIDPRTFNIQYKDIEKNINKNTKAILPVHLYGQCAEMDEINRIAKRHSLLVIEDAAQAIGAEHKGRRAGALGDLACFSFYPTKNLSCFGDGGMVTTHNDDLAERLRVLRVHGAKPKYYHSVVGVNARLDAIQAAVLRAKMRHLPGWNERRREIARFYDSGLKDAGVVVPYVEPHCVHVYHQYVIRSQKRDELAADLKAQGVDTAVYYPVPLHVQKCFADLGYKEGDLPESERAARETLALPIFPEMTQAEMDYVVRCIRDFGRKA
jgi:dTDP-4-amino-4,6-dideoxygalactose transaminase